MNWVRKRKLLLTKAILFNRQLYSNLVDLWSMLYSLYNSAQNRPINSISLQEIPTISTTQWPLFSVAELYNALQKYNDSLTSGPDHIPWHHLKCILNDPKCTANIVNIANVCIRNRHWPIYFKRSMSVIIPKPNRASYNLPKAFYSIILLNTMGELIEKIISNHL